MSLEHTRVIHTELIDVLKNIFAQEENTLRLVLQKNTGEKFLYPPLDNILYMKVDKVLDVLDFIVSTGFMIKKQVETLKFCPICFSYDFIPTEHCTNCGSTNISRGRIIEHFSCGYKNLESSFMTNDGLQCPRCHKALLVVNEDHSRGKLMYKCHACGNLYDEPVMDYHCQKCGEYFPRGELGETVVYQYEVTDHKMELIKSSLKALESLESSLKENNYSAKRSTEVVGTSGCMYNVDLYATNDKGENILAETYLLEDKLKVDEILRLQAISYDLNANKIVIITHASFDQRAESLANYYNVQIVMPEKTGKITKEQVIKLL